QTPPPVPDPTSGVVAARELLIMRPQIARAASPGSARAYQQHFKGVIMSDVKLHRVQASWTKDALIDNETYGQWYAASVSDPDLFWGEHGKRIDWFKPYTRVKNASFDGDVDIRWFEDGETNVSYN